MKTGTAEDLANDEMVRKVYLGKNFELRRRKSATMERIEAERAAAQIDELNQL